MRAFALALLALVACSRRSSPALDENSPVVLPEAATPLASVSASPSADAALAPKNDDAGANDFEDQFDYDADDADAGKGDPSALTKKPGYDSYANPRFGFSLDVPRALDAMPEPTNGDGLQWRLGHLISITASGMNFMPDLGIPFCAVSKNVSAHSESKSGCFSTGKRGGYIFWERHVIARDVDFSLRFEYAESLKNAMDPIVTHVNASWLH